MTHKIKHIDHFLERILKSPVFSKSPVNRELLKYLVQASIKGENPKEYQIAAEVFGRRIGVEKETNVRVYILNLRKKLLEYYKNEGKEDELVIELPKGGYRVRFRYSRAKSLKRKISSVAPLLLILSVVIFAISVFIMVYSSSGSRQTNIEFWRPFLKNDHPVFVILGDHYFFKSRIATGKMVTVRDNNINSDADYERFVTENKSKADEIEKSDITYINNQAPIGLFHIMNIIGSGADIKMDYSSRIRMEDFRGHHVIFIGSFKTLRSLAPTAEELGFRYNIKNSLLEYTVEDSTLRFNNYADNYLHYEYAGIAHFIARDGRHILFFFCDNDIGNIALTKYFTNDKNMKAFQTALKTIGNENFKGIFEVKGQKRTDFEISLVRIDPLPDDISGIWP